MSDVTVVISNSGPQGAAGQGVPVGGTLGQLLRKASSTNYDTEWADAGAGLGTVTSVGLSLPGIFTVSGSPVTGAGTLTAVLATQAAARVFAGPSAGDDAAPTFRALLGTDVPLATTSTQGTLSAADKTRLDQLGADDSPSFAGLTITGTDAVVIPHIHGELAGPVYIHVKQTGATTLAKGTPVYVVGAVGDTSTLEVQAADSSDPAKMPAIGLLGSSLAQNATGHAIVAGELLNAATGSYAVGDPLYVAAGGGLTATRPTSGTIQQVAIVGRAQAETGSLTATIASQQDPNWDTAYSQRLRWDGGATGLDAATGRASLGLGTAATTAATDYATATHVHGNISNVGAIGSTSGLPIITGTSGVLQAGSFGSTSGTFAQGDDARFHDAVTLGASVADLLSLTGQVLSADSPGADRLWFWDHSAGKATHLTTDSALLIDGATLRALSTLVIPLTGEATNLTQTTLLTVPWWPEARVLTDLPIWMLNAAATGSAAQFDIRVGGVSIFATLPTIDATEASSATAATAAVFSSAFISGGQQIAQGASVAFLCTQIGATVAGAGLKVALPSRRAS